MDSILWSEGLAAKVGEIIKTAILLADPGGRIRFANAPAAAMLGRPQREMVGKKIEILFLPDDLDILLPNIMNMTFAGSGFEGEALLRKGTADSFFVNLSTALYRDDSTGNRFAIFAFQDVTQLKEIEQAYHSSERFAGLGLMTDEISHQIRNPIASIGGFALRLARDHVSPDEYSQYSTIIHTEAKRLEHIIDRLVELARVHSIRYSPLTFPEILREVRDAFSYHLEKHPGAITFPATDSLSGAFLYGDRGLLITAIRSVLQNSLDATGEKGGITVRVDMTKNQALVRVRDNGEGIPAKNFPFVFDPFFTTRFNYLGLGLTLARRIVEAHKGRITIESEEGKGTEVVITLPRDRRREIRTKLLRV